MDTTLVRIGIPGIALALSALFVAATWRTGEGLAPAARRRRTILAGAGVAIWLAARRPRRCRACSAASICARRRW